MSRASGGTELSVLEVEQIAVSPSALLFHGAGFDPAPLADALRSERIELHYAAAFSDVPWVGETPAVLVVDDTLLQRTTDVASELAMLPESVVLVATTLAITDRLAARRVTLSLTGVDADADLRVCAARPSCPRPARRRSTRGASWSGRARS
jgi:hypothetical protein